MVSAILKAIPSDAAQQVAFSGHAAAPVPGPCPQPAIKAVLIEGCSPKAFCSGGDVKALRQVSARRAASIKCYQVHNFGQEAQRHSGTRLKGSVRGNDACGMHVMATCDLFS